MALEGGAVYWSPATGAAGVVGEAADHYVELGETTSWLGSPTSAVAPHASPVIVAASPASACAPAKESFTGGVYGPQSSWAAPST